MKLAILGAGLIGSGLTRAALRAGYDVVVFNRTTSKIEPLVACGASAAATVAEALHQSDAAIVIVSDEAALRSVLLDSATASALAGKRLINLSTTSSEGIRAIAVEAAAFGGELSEGSVLVYPDVLEHGEGWFALGCSLRAEQFWTPILGKLGQYVKRVGDVGEVSKADIPFLVSAQFNAIIVAYAAALGTKFRIPADYIRDQLTSNPTLKVCGAAPLLDLMQRRSYNGGLASIATMSDGLSVAIDRLQEVGMPTQILDCIQNLYAAAAQRGDRTMDAASIYEVLLQE